MNITQFIFKAGRGVLRILMRLYVLIHVIVKKTFTILDNIIKSLQYYGNTINESQDDKNSKVCRIDITSDHPFLVRDILIIINRIRSGVQCVPDIESIEVSIREGVFTETGIGELFALLSLNPSRPDIHFIMKDDTSGPSEDTTGNCLYVSVDGSRFSADIIDYFKNCNFNYLDAPPHERLFARNSFKYYKIGTFFISLCLPGIGNGNEDNIEAWQGFFRRAAVEMPEIHFLLLNYSIKWQDGFLYKEQNVTLIKTQGYVYTEEFAFARFSDMYIGEYGKYAMAVIGTKKPFIIFGLNENDKMNAGGGLSGAIRRSDCQILIPDLLSPQDLYSELTEIYGSVKALR